MRTLALPISIVFLLSAGIVSADPDNFGGKGKGWTAESSFGVDYYQQKDNQEHTKNFDSSQGAGKRFSQPGRAEGKADDRSVIQNDPLHPGTQVLPGGNR